MTLTVTGIETIEITDPQGLIDAQKPKPPSGRVGILIPGQPTVVPVTSPTPGGTPFSPDWPRPSTTGDPILNPIPLPGHTPAERPSLPWSEWTRGGRWARGLRATYGENVLGESPTEQVF